MLLFVFIVAFLLGAVAAYVGLCVVATKESNLSLSELAEFGQLMCDAGHNREATVDLWHDEECIGSITLPEK